MRLTGKYRYLTFEDRKKIEAWHLLGDRPVDIAARLSVHHTTIYKELQRGATGALDIVFSDWGAVAPFTAPPPAQTVKV